MNSGNADQRWWELHVRVARGDDLSAEDRAVYDATRLKMDESETIESLSLLKEARKDLRELEKQHRSLEQRRQELDAEIAAFETALGPRVVELLGAQE